MLKLVVFDFDGVLVDSNQMKYEAFFEIFAREVEDRAVVAGVLQAKREASRYEIIREILSKSDRFSADHDEKVNDLAEKYNGLVERGAVQCNEIPGAHNCLTVLSKRYRLYVNSMTPSEPLDRIVRKRGWSSHFQGIYGGPGSKVDNLKAILSREDATGGDALVVGDGISDWTAAKALGSDFIGIRNAFNGFDDNDFTTLPDLNELPAVLEARYSVEKELHELS